MQDEEPVLLHEPDLMLAILHAGGERAVGLEAALTRLLALRAAAWEPPPAEMEDLRRRLGEAARMLAGAGAIEPLGEGRFRLTGRGFRLRAENRDGVDQSVLHQFPEFRRFMAQHSPGHRDDPRLPAFTAGMDAFIEGAELSDNPYAFDSPDHLAWANGWSEARDGALVR